jgi:hypothetical protein
MQETKLLPVVAYSGIAILKKIYGRPKEDNPQSVCKRQNYSRIAGYS